MRVVDSLNTLTTAPVPCLLPLLPPPPPSVVLSPSPPLCPPTTLRPGPALPPPPSPSSPLLHSWASFGPKPRPSRSPPPSVNLSLSPPCAPRRPCAPALPSARSLALPSYSSGRASFDPKRRPEMLARTPSPHLAFVLVSSGPVVMILLAIDATPLLKVSERAPPRAVIQPYPIHTTPVIWPTLGTPQPRTYLLRRPHFRTYFGAAFGPIWRWWY